MQRLLDRDLLSALVLLCIGGVFWFSSGSGPKDWIFPLLAIYAVLVIAVIIVARVLFAVIRHHAPDIIDGLHETRTEAANVLVFCTIVLVFLLFMKGLGFWLSSLMMLTFASLYLTLEKTFRNLMLALIFPLLVCTLAYLVFMRVFYIPLPQATWWSGLF